jgi:hypothetical protein
MISKDEVFVENDIFLQIINFYSTIFNIVG